MDMLDVLEEALAQSVVAYGEFLHYFNRDRNVVYAFVEGRDDPSFYRSAIDAILLDGWSCRIFRPGNKKKVLEVYRDMNWSRYPREAICFFVDRDLSDFLSEPCHTGSNLYVTDSYSIENELTCTGMFKRILEEDKGVTGFLPGEEDILERMFEENLTFFKQGMVAVMAQIVLIRRTEGGSLNARLDNVKPRRFFTYSAGRIAFAAEFADSMARARATAEAVDVTASSNEEIAEMEREFRAKEGVERFIRGKYLIQFLSDCTNEIQGAIPTVLSRFDKIPGSNGILSPGTAMVVLGPRCRCPQSLRAFLNANYVSYISGRIAA
jgi:hypothetical protein